MKDGGEEKRVPVIVLADATKPEKKVVGLANRPPVVETADVTRPEKKTGGRENRMPEVVTFPGWVAPA